MSGYSARIRSLEGRIAPNGCSLCGGIAIDFVTLHEGETLPPRPPCAACGKPRKAFIVVLDRPTPESAALDNNGRAETARVRRRRYCGPG